MPEGPIRRQRPVKGGRHALSGAMIAELERRITAEAQAFHVSRSFVIATCCAYALGVTEQDDYAAPNQRLRLRGRRPRPEVAS